jgi:hypothetical protein
MGRQHIRAKITCWKEKRTFFDYIVRISGAMLIINGFYVSLYSKHNSIQRIVRHNTHMLLG